MKCPKCGNEMETGYIYAANKFFVKNLEWLPENIFDGMHLLPHSKSGVIKKGGAVIPLSDSFRINYKKTYLCKKCRKLIIDY